MNKRKTNYTVKIRAGAVLAAGVFAAALPSTTVFADTKDQLGSAQQEAESYSASNQQLSSELSSLLDELNTSMEDLTQIDSQISGTQQQIDELDSQISEDQATADEMYDSMALRVRYMYENSSSNSAINTLLSSDNFAEFLKRTSYFAEISSYDRNQIEQLNDIITSEQEKKAEQEEKLASLQELRDSQANAQANFQSLITQKRDELKKNSELMAEADALVSSYRAQLESEQLSVDDERMSAADAASSEAAGSTTEASESAAAVSDTESTANDASEDTASSEGSATSESSSQEDESGSYTEPAASESSSDSSSASYSQTELDVMAALMEGEAGPNNYEAELAVGSCVMNRVASGSYGGTTVLEVIYAPQQFIAGSSYSSMFEAILARGASSTCYEAARAVLSGTVTHPYQRFVSAKTAEARGISGVNIGGNVFY